MAGQRQPGGKDDSQVKATSGGRVNRIETGVAGFLTKRPSVDYVILVAVTWASYHFWTSHGISDLDNTGRRAVYQTGAAISTAMFGLTMTSISILISNVDKAFVGFANGLPNATRVGIARTMFALLRALACFVLFACALLIADTATTKSNADFVHAAFVGAAVVVAARTARVTFLLANMVPALKGK